MWLSFVSLWYVDALLVHLLKLFPFSFSIVLLRLAYFLSLTVALLLLILFACVLHIQPVSFHTMFFVCNTICRVRLFSFLTFYVRLVVFQHLFSMPQVVSDLPVIVSLLFLPVCLRYLSVSFLLLLLLT